MSSACCLLYGSNNSDLFRFLISFVLCYVFNQNFENWEEKKLSTLPGLEPGIP